MTAQEEFQRTVWICSPRGDDHDIWMKIVTVGAASVGKSSLMARFVHDSFSSKPVTTICVDYTELNLVIRNKKVRCTFWDTAGQDQMMTVVRTYLRDAHLMLFVFDLTNEQSYVQLKSRIERERMVADGAVCALVGTKFDLFERLPATAPERQLFTQENMDSYAVELGFTGGAHQVSSLSRYNVERTILTLLNRTVEWMEKNTKTAERESLNLARPKKQSSSGCCKS